MQMHSRVFDFHSVPILSSTRSRDSLILCISMFVKKSLLQAEARIRN